MLQNTIYNALLVQHDGRHQITLGEAARVLGIAPSTLYHAADLPFSVTATIGGRRAVAIAVLAEYLAKKVTPAPKHTIRAESRLTDKPRRRGRPTKAEQIARRRAGGEA